MALRVARIRAFVTPMMEILAAFGIAGVVWYGGYSVVIGGRTQGSFLAFLTALFLLYDPFKGLGKTNGQLQQGLAAADRVFELLDTPLGRRRPARRARAPTVRHGIEFDDVTLPLPDRAGAARREPQPSSAAKWWRWSARAAAARARSPICCCASTTSAPGAIRIDGVDIRDVTQASLRAQMALVTQHTFLFNDSVKNNIAYGCDRRSSRWRPSSPPPRAAHAHDFIMELPEGYDTMIGELGLRLSGGQRQRLAIARALLKNAPDPGARRGHLGARQRIRAPRAAGARDADARPHHAGHRAPPVDHPQRRPHRRPGARPDRRAGHARRAARAERRLPQAARPAVRRSRRRRCGSSDASARRRD